MQWIKCVCNVFPVACQFPARVTICWYRFLINKLCDPTLLQALVCLLLLIRGYCQSFVMCAESCSQDFMSWHCCLLHSMISRKRRRGKGDVVRIRSGVHSNTQPCTNTHSHTYLHTNSHICTHIQTCTCECTRMCMHKFLNINTRLWGLAGRNFGIILHIQGKEYHTDEELTLKALSVTYP